MSVDQLLDQAFAVEKEAGRLLAESQTLRARCEELNLHIKAWEAAQKEPHAWRKLMKKQEVEPKKEKEPELKSIPPLPITSCPDCGARAVRRNQKNYCLDCLEYCK